MNLKFEQFSVGDTISFEKKFQLEDFKKFAEISGDLNPLHHDAEYAAVYGNNQTIVPLHLIVGPLSRIAGMNFPGTASLYLSHSVRAVSQLKYGETITYSAKIIALNPGKRVMTIKVIGLVGAKVIFDAEMNTRALRSEWGQEIDCELIKNSSKKRVLITGSSGAIGSAIARKFAQEGWPLLLQSRSKRALNEAVLVSANDASLELIEADLSTKKGLDSLIEKIELLDDIGAVVHTASPPLNSPLRDLAEINYSALKSIANAILPQMLRQQYGKIMSIGSTAMLSLIDGFEDYAAAKSMAASYLKGLDAGFSAYGVNGYVFAPDFVATEYSKEIRGSAPSLLPAEVASKLYEALTSDSSFMTVQYIGSSEDGTYGFMPSRQLDTNLPLSAVASKNDEEKSFYNKGANDEKLVVCIKLVLPNASNEQIRNGGMGLTPGWDSLAQIQVMLEVERHFKQKFSSVDFETLKTYNGILAALKTHKVVL
mgnify:CR=1 FL=1